jgi:hypothetical protein
MPPALRAQVALVGFLAVLLIPIGTSSLRGLTHVLTCREEAATPFAIDVPEDGAPVISSSTVIERPEGGEVPTGELCGGLVLDLAVGSNADERAEVQVTITNNSDYGWRGTVQLRLDDIVFPIDIGAIDAGESESGSVPVRVRQGNTYTMVGTLLIGPS